MNIRTFTLVIALFFTINAVFAATTFSGSGNHIDQRAIISNGFSLANEDTVCSTATVFPISGPISINNGTLRLAEDTMLSSSATIATGGRIEGNAKQLSIARRIAPVQFPENTSYAGVINSYTKRFGYRVGAFGCAKKHHDEGTLCAAVAYGEAATTLDVFTMSNGGFAPRASMQIGGGSRCLVWSPNQYDGLCGIQGQSGLLHFSLDDSLSNIRAKNYSFDALTSEVAAIAWHPSGEYALIAQVNERSPFLLLKRTNDGFILKATYEGIVGPITTIGWSPDGTMCAIGTVANSSGKELAFFSFDDDSGLTLVKNYSVGAHVSWISWRPNESECWVALVGNSLSACLQSFSWTEGSGDPEVKKYAIKKSVYDVVWNKDGNLLALTTELDQTRGEVGVYQLRGNRLERANATVYDSKQFTACWSMQENVVYTVDNYGNIMMSEVAAGMQLDNITIASQSSLSLAAANCIERDVAFAGDGVTISTLVPDPFYLKEGAALLFHDCVFTPKHENTVIEAMPNAEVIINNGAILPASKLTSHASIVFSGHCRVSGDIYSKSIILRPIRFLSLLVTPLFMARFMLIRQRRSLVMVIDLMLLMPSFLLPLRLLLV